MRETGKPTGRLRSRVNRTASLISAWAWGADFETLEPPVDRGSSIAPIAAQPDRRDSASAGLVVNPRPRHSEEIRDLRRRQQPPAHRVHRSIRSTASSDCWLTVISCGPIWLPLLIGREPRFSPTSISQCPRFCPAFKPPCSAPTALTPAPAAHAQRHLRNPDYPLPPAQHPAMQSSSLPTESVPQSLPSSTPFLQPPLSPIRSRPRSITIHGEGAGSAAAERRTPAPAHRRLRIGDPQVCPRL